MKIVYKITYPNGKIYVGKDLTNDINYFGSPESLLISKDFTEEERKTFTITREILWQSETACDKEVSDKEIELIESNFSNNPKIGYNQVPRLRN